MTARRLRLSMLVASICASVSAFISVPALAWGPDGHHTTAAIAARLIAGTKAEARVKAILGDTTLIDAAVWADCAKGIDPNKDFTYTAEGIYPECKVFETPEGEAEMSDFVRRNATNCDPRPGEEICHKQYHYSDVSITQPRYKPGVVGARPDDIVGAITAAIHKLKGEPVPAPFNVASEREALLLLVHYIGDVHQPLHVGAIYLGATGARVNPDLSGYDPATDTHGGNSISAGAKNLHATWDDIPSSLLDTKVDAAWIARARGVPPTLGPIDTWSTHWATGTLGEARRAFRGLKFAPTTASHWSTTLPAIYPARMLEIKQQQLTDGGARLAQLLRALWP